MSKIRMAGSWDFTWHCLEAYIINTTVYSPDMAYHVSLLESPQDVEKLV